MDEKMARRVLTMEAYSKVKNGLELRFVANYMNFLLWKQWTTLNTKFIFHSSAHVWLKRVKQIFSCLKISMALSSNKNINIHTSVTELAALLRNAAEPWTLCDWRKLNYVQFHVRSPTESSINQHRTQTTWLCIIMTEWCTNNERFCNISRFNCVVYNGRMDIFNRNERKKPLPSNESFAPL